jgi:ABC-type molybdenum transport system ATPase subunit/photorepair protein PhrA
LYEEIGISFKTLYQNTYNSDPLLEWVGLEKDKDKRVSWFSKGMKVRLNVARSILHKPLVFLHHINGIRLPNLVLLISGMTILNLIYTLLGIS